MRIAVMGSGGVGGYFGARLASGGCDVTFIARGAHLEAIRRDGLRVESPLGDLHIHPAAATGDPGSIGPVDLVLVAVKLWDTEAAGRAVLPLLGPGTAVLSLQNGVEKDDILAAIVGRERVVGGVTYIAAAIGRPGVVRHTGAMQRVVVGELDGRRTPRVEAILEAGTRAGLDIEVAGDIRRATWEKFVFLVGLSGLTTLTRLPVGPLRGDPDTRALLLDVMREVVAVGRARGVDLPADHADRLLAFVDGLPAEMTSSMHNDLERGNRLEVRWLSGAVVRLGADSGVPAPFNRAVYAALKPHASGRAAATASA